MFWFKENQRPVPLILGKSYFATGEKLKTVPGEEWYVYEKEDGGYYFNYPVEALKTDNKCIVYLGSCFGVPANGFGDNSFISKKNSCYIGWSGKNRIAQVDAMLLFSYMVVEGQTLDQAIKYSINKDPWNDGAQRIEYNTANHSLEGSLRPDYVNNKQLTIKTTKSIYRKEDNKTYIELKVKALGDWDFPTPIMIKLESMLYGVSNPSYEPFIGFLFSSDKEQVAHLVLDNSSTEEDLYNIYAKTLVEGEWQRVRLSSPKYLLYSSILSENYSEPVPPESETKKPVVLDSNGQPTEEICLVSGSNKSFTLDAYNGHTFETLCMDKSVCTVSLSGTTLMVTGVSKGFTYIGVYDKDNHKMAIVKVTVKSGKDNIPTDGLVAYYPFNGNANDESGNGNHGTVIGNVELTTDRHGDSNGAYRFFGNPLNYISVPDNESLHFNNFTLSAWVYTDGDDYGSGYLINKGRDIYDGSYRLGVTYVGAETSYGGSNGVDMAMPETGVWHMVTGTVEGNTAKIYLDGVFVAENTLSYSFSYYNSDPLTLGMHYYSGVPDYWAYPLLGVMDDVRIYNRVLSPSEIESLYME